MKKKLKIGIFTHDFFPIVGGQGRHLYELYLQNQLFNKVEIVVFSPAENDFSNHIRIFPETKNSRLKNLEFSLKLNKKLSGIISNFGLDIVHIHGGPGGVFLFKPLSVPVIYTSHHTYWQQFNYIKNQSWKNILSILEKKSYTNAKKIICVSEDTLNILNGRYGIEKEKLVYIPNGIDLNKFKPQKTSRPNKGILYVGRIDKRKGVDFLVNAMRLINKDDPSVTLHIVGEGKDKEKLQKLSKTNRINVKFYGSLSDNELNKLYERISIQVVPSVFEGFGITVLEAMSKKVPVIATNVDGIRGLVKNRKTGLLVNYGDSKELADNVLKLLNNQKLQKELVEHAYKDLNFYDWKKIYLDTTKLYEGLFNQK